MLHPLINVCPGSAPDWSVCNKATNAISKLSGPIMIIMCTTTAQHSNQVGWSQGTAGFTCYIHIHTCTLHTAKKVWPTAQFAGQLKLFN